MKSTLLCAAALAVLATPAAARDNSTYFGLEVGGLHVKDTDIEVDDEEFATIDHKLGVDGDMILGHDFGMFRLEAELGYKRSEHSGYDLFDDDDIDGEGRTSAYSGMLNAMVDVGQERDINFYAGAGAGYAQIIHVLEVDEEEDDDGLKIKDRGFAWQLFAGVRKQLDRHFDVGLKYRYFDGGNVSDDVDGADVETDYNSHSLLFSLIHNFNVEPVRVPPPPMPPAPPPAAPLPPATQTCPDGTVVLTTDPCPVPPPPPPPPAPVPERG